MRTLLTAAVPTLLLLATVATAGQAQTMDPSRSGTMDPSRSGTMDPSRSGLRAETEIDTGARDLVPSRDLIGKRVVHRHGGPVAGTIQSVVTGPEGQPVIGMKVANSDRTLMLGPSDFERRGNSLVLMLDQTEVAQRMQYDAQALPGYGSSTGDTATPGMGAAQ